MRGELLSRKMFGSETLRWAFFEMKPKLSLRQAVTLGKLSDAEVIALACIYQECGVETAKLVLSKLAAKK